MNIISQNDLKYVFLANQITKILVIYPFGCFNCDGYYNIAS